MLSVFRRHIVGIVVAAFVVTLVPLFLVLIKEAEPYQPQVAGAKSSAVTPVVIIDNGVKMSAYCSGKSVEEIFGELGISCFPEDRIKAFPDPAIGLGTTITIRRATPVVIYDGLKHIFLRTFSDTVKEVLKEKKIKIGAKDKINHNLETELVNNIKIVIVRVREKMIAKMETIDFETKYQDDPSTVKGKQYVSQAGARGSKKVKYKITYENGIEIKREIVSEKIIKEAKTEIVMVGTRPIITTYCGGYDSTVAQAASKYGVDGNRLCRLMMIESNGNPYAIGAGHYYGLYQYTLGFWADASSAAGFGGAKWYDATAQIYATAWAIADGQGYRWPPW